VPKARVEAPRSEHRRREKFKFGQGVYERAVGSPSGSELSPVNSAAVLLKFGKWFCHVIADSLPTL